MLPPSTGEPRRRSAGLAVRGVLAVVRAVLHQLEPVGVVAPVLAGDVVPVLALLAGQGDLRTDVGGCHGGSPSLVGAGQRVLTRPGVTPRPAPGTGACRDVAVTGLEPVTQR